MKQNLVIYLKMIKIRNVIKFKVTASKKLKCMKCKKYLYGEEGFVDVTGYNYWRNQEHSRICWNCFTGSLEEMKEDRKNKKERFVELVKRNIVRHL